MTRQRACAPVLAAAVLLAGSAAHAVRPHAPVAPASGRARRVAPPLETSARLPLRTERQVSWGTPPAARALAWSRFLGAAGTDWQASWDDATRVPSRILGRGIPAPGTVADPAAAARHARTFLAEHIDLLAPGASASDFVLVSNRLTRGMRVVGFRQTHQGLRVLGGQVSFRYKNDRLFVLGSEALPHVRIQRAANLVASPEAARALAAGWVLTDAAVHATAGPVGPAVILPLVGRAGVLSYRVVREVEVDARQPIGRYTVYTDEATGMAVARQQTLRFADGVVRYQVPVRQPLEARQPYPARRASLTVNGGPVESDEEGAISWAGTAAGALVVRAVGPLVRVINNAGDAAEQELAIEPDGAVTWSEGSDELVDAQLTAFIHARLAKDYVREHLAPDLSWLDEQLDVNVNIDDTCNAFSDGNTINFFRSSDQCQNTGRLADVVYHEFGHSVHAHAIIEGVGAFDGAHSEGLSDYLAASVTGDPGMGRGFFFNDQPLRDIDPNDGEAMWPRDVDEVHTTGLIFAGAMWDLRKLLIEQHGEEEGIALANRLYYATLERATSIPTTYAEVVAEDDDDGDLSNGTPNICDINAAFGAHGLRALGATVTPLSAEMPGQEGFEVSLAVSGLYPQCPGDGVSSASIEWFLRGDDPAGAESIDMSEGDDGAWSGVIPAVPANQVVRYRVRVHFLDGLALDFPDNPADPRYEFYVGELVPLYCTDFEDDDPFASGWTHGLSRGAEEEGADDWMWGPPSASPSSGDPPAAFSGDNVLGNDLGGSDHDGLYQPDKTNFAQSPAIDTGAYSDVHVQYWRWLNVEDAFFDKATLYANGLEAWRNFDSDQGDDSAMQHLDLEWRFQDVPVSQFIRSSLLSVKYEISSDGGLEFGGWTVDDFCVMANPDSICGDGMVSPTEECDDGDDNSDDEAGACRASCKAASCGDGVVDPGESCDDGNMASGDACDSTCGAGELDEGDCGCRVAPRGGTPVGSLGLLGLLAGLVLFVARRAAGRRRRGVGTM